MEIRKVGVAGCGLMGAGIAQVAAQAGFATVVREINPDLVAQGLARIRGFLDRGVDKGKLTAEDRQQTMARISGTTRMEDLAACDLVVEAIVEDLAAKARFFGELHQAAAAGAIFASNPASLCITEMAVASGRPSRFIGLHFFNPVPLMPLVEVVTTVTTADDAREAGMAFVRQLGKTPIAAADRTGFIVKRLLVPYLLDAVRALEQGHGTIADIDTGMRLGCGHPMGPFALLDMVGLETTVAIADIFFGEFKEPRFATPPLLRRMVLAGYHGRKSGLGFYDYAGATPVPNERLWSRGGRA
jgi:3-hydroxybutyryl-CoA dehydrogenase